jgi:asparagine synthase (glutamine-hydrolysing)
LAERPVKAFTIGFAASDVADERPAARAAAQAVGAEHVEIAFDEADFWKLLPEIVSAVDDPAADYAILPTWALARAAREAGLKVILSGEGGDELFGGYGRYRSAMRPWWAGGRTPRARGVLDGLGILRSEIAGWRDGIAAAEARNSGHRRTPLQVAQAVDCADWLPNDLLIKLDRCLMAHSTEGRTPYLDTEVAALAFRLRSRAPVCRRHPQARRPGCLESAVLRALAPPSHRARGAAARHDRRAGGGSVNAWVELRPYGLRSSTGRTNCDQARWSSIKIRFRNRCIRCCGR